MISRARIWGLGMLLCMLALMGNASSQDPPPMEEETPRIEIKLREEVFRLEIAADEEARARGLMGRESLREHGGMIFIYERPLIMSFWMANCLIDIDILFVDHRGRITAMHEMKKEAPRAEGEPEWRYHARLKRYDSRRAAQFAIELKAGWLKKLKYEVGDRLELDVEALVKLTEPKEDPDSTREADRLGAN